MHSAQELFRTCVAYPASGRVRDADVRIASNPVSERRRVRALVEDGAPVESYRRIALEETLGLLAPTS
jgi:hypothetical protein